MYQYKSITPTYRNWCQCKDFLQPVQTWREVYERSQWSSIIIKTLILISPDDEDYVMYIYRCKHCGKYWVKEDCGSPWLTRSLPFFYVIETNDIENWYQESILSRLKKNLDEDYHKLIAPRLKL